MFCVLLSFHTYHRFHLWLFYDHETFYHTKTQYLFHYNLHLSTLDNNVCQALHNSLTYQTLFFQFLALRLTPQKRLQDCWGHYHFFPLYSHHSQLKIVG